MPRTVAQEVSLASLRIDRAQARDFVTSVVGPSYFFPIWATFWALFHFINFFQIHLNDNGTSSRGSVTWYVDLTSWTYISIVLSSTVDCVISVFVHTLRRYLLEISAESPEVIPWYLRMVWVLYNTSNCSVLTATLLIGSLYPLRSDTIGLLVQTISPLYVIANIAISARETRILHFYQPVIFLFIYILANLIYCATTESRVYTAMHWTGSPIITIAISLGILLVFTPLVHLFVYGIFKLRTYLTNKKVRMDAVVLDGTS
uniref:Uncharacterized protein LOC111110428 n=1 Tax=Crassostrea virginica TaxID=6565 RepID=A0A8B8BII0_CRAVI|nr:uncharacterized protein LOC111110428 [Crassostrea virginica]